MANFSEVLAIYDNQLGKVVAEVVLNGYGIEAGNSPLPHGTMRSFKIMRGDLWTQWDQQQPLTLRQNQGTNTQVRVAAMPVDSESTGLIEFL